MTNNFESLIYKDHKPVPNLPPQLPEVMKRFLLTGKVSVITGAAGTIGSAIADGYAQAESSIAIIDYKYSPELTQSLSNKYGVKAESYQVDITDPDQVRQVIDQIVADFGTIDVFVANAGIAWNYGSILNPESTPEDWKKVYDVDVHGVFYCAKYCGQIFKDKGKGSFIMTASMSAHITNVPNFQSCYNSAKAAVLHLGKSLAVEFAGFARVNTVSPGYTDTPLSDPVPKEERAKWWGLTPLGREARPDELVGAYIYLASDASSFTTGTDIRVDGGYCSV